MQRPRAPGLLMLTAAAFLLAAVLCPAPCLSQQLQAAAPRGAALPAAARPERAAASDGGTLKEAGRKYGSKYDWPGMNHHKPAKYGKMQKQIAAMQKQIEGLAKASAAHEAELALLKTAAAQHSQTQATTGPLLAATNPLEATDPLDLGSTAPELESGPVGTDANTLLNEAETLYNTFQASWTQLAEDLSKDVPTNDLQSTANTQLDAFNAKFRSFILADKQQNADFLCFYCNAASCVGQLKCTGSTPVCSCSGK